jgi:hypothetical protein
MLPQQIGNGSITACPYNGHAATSADADQVEEQWMVKTVITHSVLLSMTSFFQSSRGWQYKDR